MKKKKPTITKFHKLVKRQNHIADIALNRKAEFEANVQNVLPFIVMKYCEGMTFERIAKELGVDQDTVTDYVKTRPWLYQLIGNGKRKKLEDVKQKLKEALGLISMDTIISTIATTGDPNLAMKVYEIENRKANIDTGAKTVINLTNDLKEVIDIE